MNFACAHTHTHTLIVFEIHFEAMLQFSQSFSKLFVPFRFSDQNYLNISHVSHLRYMSFLSHPPRIYRLYNFWWHVQIMKLLTMLFSLSSCHFLPLVSKYFPQLSSETPLIYVLFIARGSYSKQQPIECIGSFKDYMLVGYVYRYTRIKVC
jgi:hypothetical protein